MPTWCPYRLAKKAETSDRRYRGLDAMLSNLGSPKGIAGRSPIAFASEYGVQSSESARRLFS